MFVSQRMPLTFFDHTFLFQRLSDKLVSSPAQRQKQCCFNEFNSLGVYFKLSLLALGHKSYFIATKYYMMGPQKVIVWLFHHKLLPICLIHKHFSFFALGA